MLEYEWYENVRNGNQAICNRCIDVKKEITNINIEQFQFNRYGDKVYCDGCWNWMHLKRWKCDNCGLTGTLRSERPINIKSCGCGNIIEIQSLGPKVE